MRPPLHSPDPMPGRSPYGGWGVLFATVGLCLALFQGASGQSLGGRLLDVETDAPIQRGIVTLLSTDSVVITSAVSGADGRWRLDAPEPGAYLVAAEAMGYEAWVAGPVEVGSDDALDSTYHLRPQPITLDPIAVRERRIRQYLDHAGFFERQRAHFGHFITPEAIERRGASRVSDLLVTVPGVQRVMPEGGAGPVQIRLRGSNLSEGGLCSPRVFVDGLMYSVGDSRPVRIREEEATERSMDDLLRRMDDAMSVDDIAHPSSILAMEVYRSASQVPTRFGGTSMETLCGVILIWTQRGGVPDRPSEPEGPSA